MEDNKPIKYQIFTDTLHALCCTEYKSRHIEPLKQFKFLISNRFFVLSKRPKTNREGNRLAISLKRLCATLHSIPESEASTPEIQQLFELEKKNFAGYLDFETKDVKTICDFLLDHDLIDFAIRPDHHGERKTHRGDE